MDYLKNMEFITSIYNEKQFINDDTPLIAMVGKSNVGKSSFINALCNNKKMAKVGNSPGKTRCINYFKGLLENKTTFYLVDLPGYGYSKMSDGEAKSIFALTNKFLETNKSLKHVFLLLDIRHNPTTDDVNMYRWLLSKNIKFTIILNKADKLTNVKQLVAKDSIMKYLLASEEIIPFSADKRQNVDLVLDIINNI